MFKSTFKTAMVLTIVMLFSIQPIYADLFDFGKRIKGSGDIVEEKRDVKEFTKIESNGSFDVAITVGEPQKVVVEYDDNLIEYIETEVSNGTLFINTSNDVSFSSRKGCLITITVSELEAFRLSGSGDIEIENLNSDSFEYEVSGSGDLEANGSVNSLYIEINGSGDVDTEDLKAKEAKVRISGSGDASVFVTQLLDAKVFGSGDIVYYGSPDKVRSRVHGSGSIVHH